MALSYFDRLVHSDKNPNGVPTLWPPRQLFRPGAADTDVASWRPASGKPSAVERARRTPADEMSRSSVAEAIPATGANAPSRLTREDAALRRAPDAAVAPATEAIPSDVTGAAATSHPRLAPAFGASARLPDAANTSAAASGRVIPFASPGAATPPAGPEAGSPDGRSTSAPSVGWEPEPVTPRSSPVRSAAAGPAAPRTAATISGKAAVASLGSQSPNPPSARQAAQDGFDRDEPAAPRSARAVPDERPRAEMSSLAPPPPPRRTVPNAQPAGLRIGTLEVRVAEPRPSHPPQARPMPPGPMPAAAAPARIARPFATFGLNQS